MKSVGQFIEVGVSRRNTRPIAVSVPCRLNLVDGRGYGQIERHVVFGLSHARDAVDFGLGIVDQIDRIALARIAHVDNARSCVNQPAQESPLGNNRGVVAGVRRCGHN